MSAHLRCLTSTDFAGQATADCNKDPALGFGRSVRKPVLAANDPAPQNPIIPIVHKEPFDDPAYLFELKLDSFRGLVDTIQGRMLSKNGNRMRRSRRCAASRSRRTAKN